MGQKQSQLHELPYTERSKIWNYYSRLPSDVRTLGFSEEIHTILCLSIKKTHRIMLTPCVMLICCVLFFVSQKSVPLSTHCKIRLVRTWYSHFIVVIVVAGQLVQHHVHHLQHHPLLLLPECQGAGRVDRQSQVQRYYGSASLRQEDIAGPLV